MSRGSKPVVLSLMITAEKCRTVGTTSRGLGFDGSGSLRLTNRGIAARTCMTLDRRPSPGARASRGPLWAFPGPVVSCSSSWDDWGAPCRGWRCSVIVETPSLEPRESMLEVLGPLRGPDGARKRPSCIVVSSDGPRSRARPVGGPGWPGETPDRLGMWPGRVLGPCPLGAAPVPFPAAPGVRGACEPSVEREYGVCEAAASVAAEER